MTLSAPTSGRDADAVEINGIVQVDKPFDGPLLEQRMQAWIAFGATRLTFRNLDVGYTFEEHIELVHRLGATYCGEASSEAAASKPGTPVEAIAQQERSARGDRSTHMMSAPASMGRATPVM
jgi:hypothetical protein